MLLKIKLSIVIPAYNEEKRIPKTLNEYYNFFKRELGREFELIIIPNNCKDNTLDVVKKFSKNKRNVIIKDIPCYVGKGGAVIKGFELARGELIGFTDADNSTTPENFFKLYNNLNGFDGIIASRKMKGARMFPPREFSKEFSSALYTLFVRIFFNLKYKDTQCGAKLFRRNVAKALSKRISERGWEFDVNILYLCKKNNFKIREYPIFWSDCEGSKLNHFDGIKSILKLIKYRLKLIFLSKGPK